MLLVGVNDPQANYFDLLCRFYLTNFSQPARLLQVTQLRPPKVIILTRVFQALRRPPTARRSPSVEAAELNRVRGKSPVTISDEATTGPFPDTAIHYQTWLLITPILSSSFPAMTSKFQRLQLIRLLDQKRKVAQITTSLDASVVHARPAVGKRKPSMDEQESQMGGGRKFLKRSFTPIDLS